MYHASSLAPLTESAPFQLTVVHAVNSWVITPPSKPVRLASETVFTQSYIDVVLFSALDSGFLSEEVASKKGCGCSEG